MRSNSCVSMRIPCCLMTCAPLFVQLSNCPEGGILVGEDRFIKDCGATLLDSLSGFYEGDADDIELLLRAARR